MVKNFKVQNLTKYSDHKPCVTELTLRHHFTAADEILAALQEAPVRYKWPNDDVIECKFMMSMNTPSFAGKISSLSNVHCHSKEDVLELNENIVQLYREVADNVIPKPAASPNSRKANRKGNRMKAKSP